MIQQHSTVLYKNFANLEFRATCGFRLTFRMKHNSRAKSNHRIQCFHCCVHTTNRDYSLVSYTLDTFIETHQFDMHTYATAEAEAYGVNPFAATLLTMIQDSEIMPKYQL